MQSHIVTVQDASMSLTRARYLQSNSSNHFRFNPSHKDFIEQFDVLAVILKIFCVSKQKNPACLKAPPDGVLVILVDVLPIWVKIAGEGC